LFVSYATRVAKSVHFVFAHVTFLLQSDTQMGSLIVSDFPAVYYVCQNCENLSTVHRHHFIIIYLLSIMYKHIKQYKFAVSRQLTKL